MSALVSIIGALRAELADTTERRDIAEADTGRLEAAIGLLEQIGQPPTAWTAARNTARPAEPAPKPEAGKFAERTRAQTARDEKNANHSRVAKWDYEEVARVAIAARDAGRSMAKAVAEAFGVSSSIASAAIGNARNRGFIPAVDKTRTKAAPERPQPWTADDARTALEQIGDASDD